MEKFNEDKYRLGQLMGFSKKRFKRLVRGKNKTYATCLITEVYSTKILGSQGGGATTTLSVSPDCHYRNLSCFVDQIFELENFFSLFLVQFVQF